MASVPFLAVQNPENDPFGVDLSRIYSNFIGTILVGSFPSLESFRASFMCLDHPEIDADRSRYAWSCSDASIAVLYAEKSSRVGARSK
jgi:hypothetical protein